MNPHEYCQQTLQKVSRTFAINIAFLQGDLYKAILCAYLFCRIADTIEDTVFRDREKQKSLLQSYKGIFKGRAFTIRQVSKWVDSFKAAEMAETNESEDHKLVQNTYLVVENFLTLPLPYRQAICDCLVEMSEGMLATIRLKEHQANKMYFSKTIAELNRYCYYVAGTVGILLTKFFATHSRSITNPIIKALNRNAVSFGLGLQMTNIIK
ncbi:MAG: squalene/phytoene synthase family protein, partial [bacterium]